MGMVRFNEYDPIDFWPMVNGKHALVRSIAVSMYFGLIDFKKICPSCDGNMKLHPKNIHRNYTDGFHWICCEDGRTLFNHTTPKLGKIKRIYCRRELSIRDGNWVSQLNYPLTNVLQAIYYWTRDLKQKDIKDFS